MRLIRDIGFGLLIALVVVLVALFSTGQTERFVYGAF